MISDQVPKLIGDQFDQPSNVHGKTGPKSVFFNLFAAAEPYTSVKVTHGTPCIDL